MKLPMSGAQRQRNASGRVDFAARMDDLNLLAELLGRIERIPHIPLGDRIAWG